VKIFKVPFIAGFVVLLLFPLGAIAHPMGNFSISHYSKLTINGQDIHIDYILDFAEIPTFQMFPEFRANGADSNIRDLAREWAGRLELTIDGRSLPLEWVDSMVESNPGAGGLPTVRVTLRLESRWRGRSGTLHFRDLNFPARIGWKEIVVQATPPLGFPEGNAFAEDRSAALSRYPADLLATAPNVVEATIRIGAAPIRLTNTAPAKPNAAESTTLARDQISQILGREALPVQTVLLGMLVAFSLGALHALSPGHGKTVVASFLVGARGTARHAAFLGAVVTFTHTIGVFLLGLVVLFLSRTIVPEQIYPWIGFLSGLTILGVGVNLFRQRLSHLTHDHGPHGHSHEIPAEITFRNLLALGFSGGIVPCPSALVVLLSAIALHRVGTGLLFILAFSLGLASVLVAIGILVVRASRLLSRFGSERSAIRFVPLASAAIISVLGLGMAVQALSGVSFASLNGGLLLSGQAIAVLSLGLFLGLKHATDADHVVAVTTFVSQESNIIRSCWIGAFWGLGHTLSLAVAGVLVIGLKVNVPGWLSERLELGVAAMLVVLGANVILRTLRSKAEVHRHDHVHEVAAEARHSHWHIHLPGHSHDHSGWTHAGLRPLLTGMVHGAAGSAALMLLVLSTIRSPLEAFLYILIFGLGSIVGMLGISFLLALPLHWARARIGVSYKPVQLLAGLFSCVFGLLLGVDIWMSLR
jgi:ABC-type nickel/cobalt efflux system permease component RcnA